jgi:PKD repeat protein
LNYTQQALYGIQGIVSNVCSGEPLHAKVFIQDHDKDESYVMTDPRVGFYARYLKAGIYSVTYSADGYASQTVPVTVSDKQKIIKNIELMPIGITNLPIANFEAEKTEILENESVYFNNLSENADTWEWYFEGGTPQNSTTQNPSIIYENYGVFDVKLKVSNADCSNEMLMENYITVNRLPNMPIANFEAEKTEILENESVYFNNLSENADTWEWYFEGGTPETSNEQNPNITYKTKGEFDVKLTVSNSDGSDKMMKENYIVVNELKISEDEKITIKIFPNPVAKESILTIDSKLLLEKIELLNLLGTVVKTDFPKTNIYSFSVSGIEQGLYIMKITTTKGIYFSKIQIQ